MKVPYLLKNGGNMAKLIKLSELKNLKKKFKNQRIGLCHGAFDILHNGHLEHFKEAKNKVDILVISVTGDKFIIKGPNQPYNNEFDRSYFLTHIKEVDYVYIDQHLTAESLIKSLKPNFYVKGKDYKDKDLTNNLKKEVSILKKYGGKLMITNTRLLSSSKIINKIQNNLSEEVDKYLQKLNNANAFEKILGATEKMKKMSINIIGEPILDKYVQCEMAGLTTKDPAVSSIIQNEQTISGGVISISKIVSKFVKKVKVFTYGNSKEISKFYKGYKNIKVINFDKKQKFQMKTRYINANRFEKLLQITNFKKNKFNDKEVKNVIKKIKNIKNNLIICDFGIGLFEGDLLKYLNKIMLKKFLNVQSNSINLGLNLFTKYVTFKYLSLDEREWRLGLQKTNDINLNEFIKKKQNREELICSLTKGKKGSELFTRNKKFESPVFVEKTLDTTGCGDAYFALTSLLIMANLPLKIVPFAGNIYAGMHGQYFGNETITNTVTYLKYVKSILKR